MIAYLSSLISLFIILGDFIELSFHLDKLGGSNFRFSRLTYMNMLFDLVECIELPFEVILILDGKNPMTLIILFSVR